MLENRSFDQVLGYRDPSISTYSNYMDGKKYTPREIPYFNGEGYGRFSHDASLYSINTPFNDSIQPNGGFVYANKHYQYMPTLNDENPPDLVMGYFPPHPLYQHFVDNYVLCDRYFSSVPGQTDPNRFFLLSGTSSGQVNGYLYSFDMNTMFAQTQPTILTQLKEKGYEAKVYSNTNIPESLLLLDNLNHIDNFHPLDTFFRDVATSKLPLFSHIEPAYERINIQGRNTDQYEFELVESVYNALRNNEEVWNHCIFILNFDEHGGYHDHIHPPQAVPPDSHSVTNTLYNFNQYGVRVPCFIISPFVDNRVDSTVYDHTSLLSTIHKLCGINPLTNRDKYANNFLHLFTGYKYKPKYSDKIYNLPQPQTSLESILEYVVTFGIQLHKLSGLQTNKNYIIETFSKISGMLKFGFVSVPSTSKNEIVEKLVKYFDTNPQLSKYKMLLYAI